MNLRIPITALLLALAMPSTGVLAAPVLSDREPKNGREKDFSIEVLPSSQSIVVGATAIYAVILTPIEGFDDKVSLQLSGNIVGATGITVSLNQPTGKPAFTSLLRINTNPKVQTPQIFTFIITATGTNIVRSASAVLRITPSTAPTKAEFAIAATPSARNVNPGEAANYVITLTSISSFAGTVSLSLLGTPPGSSPAFSPPSVNLNAGDATNSSLSISTTPSTPPRTYSMRVIGTSGGISQMSEIVLIVGGARSALAVIVSASSNQTSSANSTVSITGVVRDPSSNPVPGAEVSIQVVDPQGSIARIDLKNTDASGAYSTSFQLPNSNTGTYTVFVTANKAGFRDGRAQTTFVIGEGTAPSTTVNVFTTTVDNTRKSQFRSNEQVVFVVVVTNAGAPLEPGVIWIQVEDPSGASIFVQAIKQSKIQGRIEISTQFGQKLAATGTYKVNALVSDKFISEGGRFMSLFQSSFVIVG